MLRASYLRTVGKTISWRVLGSLDTFALSYLLTGKVAAAGAIASTEVLTKSVLYFFHERAWTRISPTAAPVAAH